MEESRQLQLGQGGHGGCFLHPACSFYIGRSCFTEFPSLRMATISGTRIYPCLIRLCEQRPVFIDDTVIHHPRGLSGAMAYHTSTRTYLPGTFLHHLSQLSLRSVGSIISGSGIRVVPPNLPPETNRTSPCSGFISHASMTSGTGRSVC